MADLEGLKVAKDYHIDTPFANQDGFYVKGANSLDWGMKRHLANIFNPKSGNTVMFAFDHGYFMGSTAGLERLDLLLPKLAPYVEMCIRDSYRTEHTESYESWCELRFRRQTCGWNFQDFIGCLQYYKRGVKRIFHGKSFLKPEERKITHPAVH